MEGRSASAPPVVEQQKGSPPEGVDAANEKEPVTKEKDVDGGGCTTTTPRRRTDSDSIRASGGLIARTVDGYAAKLRDSLSSGELRRKRLPNLRAMIRPVVPPPAESEVLDAFSAIPQEIMFVIFQNLDVKAICLCGAVCALWKVLSEDLLGLYALNLEKNTVRAQRQLRALRQIAERLGKKVSAHDALAVERVNYLLATVDDLISYFTTHKNTTEYLPELIHLLIILNKQLGDTNRVLSSVLTGKEIMNENYDIFELTLRRYFYQFSKMFPVDVKEVPQHPSDIINDPKAKILWDTHIGKDEYMCDFKKFYGIVKEEAKNPDNDLKDYLMYFLNFPKDNTVTTFKWDTLTRLFGSYDEFYANFKEYVLGTGFLGAINRVRAMEILKDHPKGVLMRFSRTHPGVLAFSSYTDDGKSVVHMLNAVDRYTKTGKPIPAGAACYPIRMFLEEYSARGFTPVPLRVNGRAVAKNGYDLEGYIKENSASGYYCASNLGV